MPLGPSHLLDGFDSGQPSLDHWLARRALKNQRTGASRTFVTTPIDDAGRVVGFYSLAASSAQLDTAPGPVRRNMPDPIPVSLLGRLAIDRTAQGKGLARGLLQDALRRIISAADTIGIRALLVHAIDDDAAMFYHHFGFIPSPLDDHTLFLPIERIRASAPPALRRQDLIARMRQDAEACNSDPRDREESQAILAEMRERRGLSSDEPW
ncbi:MAG: GNAT family N-acetyltransferase [Propionibacteriaceae bacterium]|nr:GNAT family N-acetyltransferase [Propionibacteriaceae bacterium]